MAITRTARGTVSADTTGDRLEMDLTLGIGESGYIAVASPHVGGAPSRVRWGSRDLSSRVSDSNVGSKALNTYLVRRESVDSAETRPLVVKWPASVGDRVLIAVGVGGVSMPDQPSSGTQDASAFATSGTTGNIYTDDEMAIGFHASDGTSTDTAGTPQDSFTAGQRVSTANIDLRETYKDLTGTTLPATVRSRINTISPVRDWTSTILTFRSTDVLKIATAGGDEYLTEPDLDSVYTQMETLINNNWTALNNTLPSSAQTNLSNQQKMDVFVHSLVYFEVPVKV